MPEAAGSWRLRHFPSLPSTQDFCRAQAEAGEPAGLAVLADRQTEGRGTHGRTWQSPSGNLALSVLLRPTEPARMLPQWSLLAAVATMEALAAYLPPRAALSCKWPNDVLLNGGKIAGLLVEAAGGAAGTIDWLVIGFGVNLAAAPSLPERRTACLADWVQPPAPADFAQTLLSGLGRWLDIRRAAGFAPVREYWLNFAPAPGSAILLRRGGRSRDGHFAGLSDEGYLLLATETGVETIVAGET